MGTEKAFLHLHNSNHVTFDVNVRMVLLRTNWSWGTQLKKISTVLGIPGLYLTMYQKHD